MRQFGSTTRLLGAPALVANWSRRGVIKSIQTGSIDLNNVTSGTNSPAITAVDVNNSILLHLGHNSTYGGASFIGHQYTRLTLTNSTTVTATCGLATATAIPVKWVLLEFWPGTLKSVQYGGVAIGAGTTNTAPINAVDVTKATVIPLGHSTTLAGASAPSSVAFHALTNSTTVTATIAAAANATTTSFVVVEWY